MPIQPAAFTPSFYTRYTAPEMDAAEPDALASASIHFNGSSEAELLEFEQDNNKINQLRGQYRQIIDTFKQFVNQHGDEQEKSQVNENLDKLRTHLLEPQIATDRVRMYGSIKRNLDTLCRLLQDNKLHPQLLLSKIKETSLEYNECFMGIEEKTTNVIRDLRLGQQGFHSTLQLTKELLFEQQALAYIQQHLADHPQYSNNIEVHIVTKLKNACTHDLGLTPSMDTWDVHWLTEEPINHFKAWIKTELTPTKIAESIAGKLQSECATLLNTAVGNEFTVSWARYQEVINELQQHYGTGWDPAEIIEFIDNEPVSDLVSSAGDLQVCKIKPGCIPLTISLLEEMDRNGLLNPGFKAEFICPCTDPDNPHRKGANIFSYDQLFWLQKDELEYTQDRTPVIRVVKQPLRLQQMLSARGTPFAEQMRTPSSRNNDLIQEALMALSEEEITLLPQMPPEWLYSNERYQTLLHHTDTQTFINYIRSHGIDQLDSPFHPRLFMALLAINSTDKTPEEKEQLLQLAGGTLAVIQMLRQDALPLKALCQSSDLSPLKTLLTMIEDDCEQLSLSELKDLRLLMLQKDPATHLSVIQSEIGKYREDLMKTYHYFVSHLAKKALMTSAETCQWMTGDLDFQQNHALWPWHSSAQHSTGQQMSCSTR
ncbi:MAG: hypothetical protein ACRC5A_04790 [Enterobacteriaceae bacterium]